jgi:hypothetical protein
MAKRSRQTFQKHQKEQARQRKQQAKAARRLEAKQRRATAASESHGAPLEVTDIDRGLQPVPTLGHHANQQAEPL